ncbi:MAG: acyltransferase family protein, partial [Pseudomonadota bacterium]
HLFGAKPETIVFASRASLVPTWFLAIYTVIVLLAPLTYAFWRRWGVTSFAVYVVLAVVVDFAYFQLELRWLGWTNYFWVWLAVHHLGFMWRDNRLPGPVSLFFFGLLGIAGLVALVFMGPYPLAMAGSPDESVSNSLPPKITLIALGVFQFGMALSIEKPMRRFLSSLRVWAATVIVNTFIMTIYLWHMTILVIVLGISFLLDGFGLSVEPGSSEWWWSRPLWLLTLLVLLLPVAMALSPLERRARPKGAPVPAAWRLILGAVAACLGIALLTLFGFDGDPFNRLDIVTLALVLAGASVAGLRITS